MMTNVVYIDGTHHAPCTFCGKVDELRPYGPNHEVICFDCAMKDEPATAKQFAKLLDGTDVMIIK